MKDIKKKAFDDELNKSKEEIEDSSWEFIPVPKIIKEKKEKNKKEDKDGK
jgi:hypothetical protein